jgi:hypothetical protein
MITVGFSTRKIDDEFVSLLKKTSGVPKIEVIPFENDSLDEGEEFDENAESFNIFGLCEKYVGRLASLDDSSKERVLNKINNLYINIIKDVKE